MLLGGPYGRRRRCPRCDGGRPPGPRGPVQRSSTGVRPRPCGLGLTPPCRATALAHGSARPGPAEATSGMRCRPGLWTCLARIPFGRLLERGSRHLWSANGQEKVALTLPGSHDRRRTGHPGAPHLLCETTASRLALPARHKTRAASARGCSAKGRSAKGRSAGAVQGGVCQLAGARPASRHCGRASAATRS
jgi:hypothetical protein